MAVLTIAWVACISGLESGNKFDHAFILVTQLNLDPIMSIPIRTHRQISPLLVARACWPQLYITPSSIPYITYSLLHLITKHISLFFFLYHFGSLCLWENGSQALWTSHVYMHHSCVGLPPWERCRFWACSGWPFQWGTQTASFSI